MLIILFVIPSNSFWWHYLVLDCYFCTILCTISLNTFLLKCFHSDSFYLASKFQLKLDFCLSECFISKILCKFDFLLLIKLLNATETIKILFLCYFGWVQSFTKILLAYCFLSTHEFLS